MPSIPTPNLAQIPGGATKPSGTYKKTAQYIQALSDLLPYYQQALQGSMPSQAAAEFGLFSEYAPKYNEIGQNLNASNAAADAKLLQGEGKDLTLAALENAKLFDPEYFKTRGETSDALSKLMASIDLSGALSPSEREEISRALSQEGMRRGTSNSPSQLDTVSNAMTFGSAGTNRKLQSQDQLTKAIAAATAFLPTSKSGVDTFQIATGKSSGNPFGGAALGAGQNTGAGQLFGQIGQTGAIRQQAALQAKASDFGSMFGSALGSSLGQSTGKLAGMAGMSLLGI